MVEADLSEAVSQFRWGDLILFKCRMPHAVAVRVVTGFVSYDHCAVVGIDPSTSELCMLESCVLGVRAFPLEQRVREYANKFADVIAWRRLLAHRPEAAQTACKYPNQTTSMFGYLFSTSHLN